MSCVGQSGISLYNFAMDVHRALILVTDGVCDRIQRDASAIDSA